MAGAHRGPLPYSRGPGGEGGTSPHPPLLSSPASPSTSSRCCGTWHPTAPSPSCNQRTARGKGLRSWRLWRAAGPSPEDGHHCHPNKGLCSAPPTPEGIHGRGGAAHGRVQPHVAIYIEFIYIHVRQTPRPRHRYVHKAKCKYLNALNTELKKRSLHNTARGPGLPGPTRRQHDGTARTTHTQCPLAPRHGAVGPPGPG